VGIFVFGPKHADLQMAHDADAFRSYLEHPGRQLAAACIDVVFAASYGLIGVLGYQATRFRPAARLAGIALVAAAALFDEVENGFLIHNIVTRDSLTDGWVDAMQVPGTLKWIGSPALLVLMIWWIVSKLRGDADGAGGEA
jgi:hypothetical protein